MTKISLPRVCKARASSDICMVVLLVFAGSVFADVGSNNPTGTAGQYNGNIEVGVDPFTMNATRSITDLVVAGGTGSYPLAFTRIMNSRFTVGVGNLPVFGAAGSWTHSYQWTIDAVKVTKTGAVGLPSQYNVNYPDGRRVTFQNVGQMPSGAVDTDYRGLNGVRDRFEQLKTGTTECYLRLTDGGKIWFHANASTTVSGSGSSAVYTTTYTFTFKGIYDPYSQLTTATYPSDGSMILTEPAGRTIKIAFKTGPAGDTVVNYVTGSDGRTVTYNYSAITASGITYSALTSVRYFGDPTWDATYTYQASNVTSVGRPLIATCTDPMFDGPLWKVAYDFKPAGTNADGSAVVYGQIWHIKHPNGTLVSTLAISNDVSNWYKRTETRGDNPTGSSNPTRTFRYHGYRLESATDFKGVAATQAYNSNNYLNSITDRRGTTTTINPDNPYTGTPGTITYQVPGDVSPSGTHTIITNSYSTSPDTTHPLDPANPYWLGCIQTPNHTNASGTTYVDVYFRNANRTLEHVQYFDGTFDRYTYNTFGQIATHYDQKSQMEEYVYGDSANPSRVTAYYDPAHPKANGVATVQYQYDGYGRVSGMTVPRLKSDGTTAYDTTTFLYNTRGQLTRLTHQDNSYLQYAYNPDGTLQWTADERHSGAVNDPTQRTGYTYDDYKRLRSISTPLRAAGDTTPRITTYFYDQNGTGEDYTRTAAVPTKVVSPGGKIVTMIYDENLRTLSVTAAGDANVPNATTSYTYDPNGNVLTVKDPNGQATGAVTTYTYDCMNRVMSVTDPIPLDRNSNGHTLDYLYDVGGRVIGITRADDRNCSYAYDDMGRMSQETDFAGVVTAYHFDPNGNMSDMNVNSVVDYFYAYDSLNRKTRMTYGSAGPFETYTYDVGNRLWQYKNPAGQTKTLTYDNRGRLTNTSWDSNGPSVTITYDATRPASITTLDGTTIAFGYDEANNRIYEDQAIAGLPSRRVQTDPDADGRRKNLIVKTGTVQNFANNFDYTSRNELLNIKNSSNAPLFTYSYDPSGNVTQRVNQTFANASDKVMLQYDSLNRATLCAQYAPGSSSSFATSHYSYSALGNLKNVTRDEDGGKGDYFTHDNASALASATYLATSSSDPNGTKSVTYSGLGIRGSMTVTDNILHTTTATNYTYNSFWELTGITTNNVNQSVGYDQNLNLSDYNSLHYVYDAENRLIAISGSHTANFVYDGVGRCVKRTIDGQTTIFSYDQWTPVAEWDQNGNLIATNVYGIGDDEILSRTAGSTQLFYKNDPMGNVLFLLNGSGIGVEKYKYDAFGSPTITDWNGNVRTSSAYGNKFMFSGREYLQGPQSYSPLGLYDLRNRTYNPTTAYFHQTDPIGFAGDPYYLYRFSGNNPLLGGDPTGLASTTIWTSGSDWGWYYDDPLSSTDDGSSGFASSDLGSEISVYNGGAYAYGNGYGPYDRYMEAIFGPSSDSGMSSWESDTSLAGRFPTFSGTAFFGGTLASNTTSNSSPSVHGSGSVNRIVSGALQLSQLSLKLANWARGLASDVQMLSEFGTGIGPRTRVFGPNSIESADMRSDFFVWGKAAEAYGSGKTANEDFDINGLINAGLHPTRQFVGSYDVEIRDGQVVVTNRTSLWSALYHGRFVPAYERENFRYGGNTYQVYILGPYR